MEHWPKMGLGNVELFTFKSDLMLKMLYTFCFFFDKNNIILFVPYPLYHLKKYIWLK